MYVMWDKYSASVHVLGKEIFRYSVSLETLFLFSCKVPEAVLIYSCWICLHVECTNPASILCWISPISFTLFFSLQLNGTKHQNQKFQTKLQKNKTKKGNFISNQPENKDNKEANRKFQPKICRSCFWSF